MKKTINSWMNKQITYPLKNISLFLVFFDWKRELFSLSLVWISTFLFVPLKANPEIKRNTNPCEKVEGAGLNLEGHAPCIERSRLDKPLLILTTSRRGEPKEGGAGITEPPSKKESSQ